MGSGSEQRFDAFRDMVGEVDEVKFMGWGRNWGQGLLSEKKSPVADPSFWVRCC